MLIGIPNDLERLGSSTVLPLAGEVNWGITKYNIDAIRQYTRGEDIIIGGVDTGVDERHPLLKPNFITARDFTGSRIGYRDVNKHGTHISGTLASTDPRISAANGAKFVHGKGLSDQGSGTDTGICQAIDFCADNGAVIISMSLGSAGRSDAIVRTMEKWTKSNNVWFVCAAGNSGANTPDVDWPGRSEWCISVGALDQNSNPASFTNRGAKIDTAMAGVNIWSTGINNTFELMSGTSMATPLCASILALYRNLLMIRKLPIPDVFGLRELLKSSSTDAGKPGVDDRTGPGWITGVLLAMDAVRDPSPLV